MHYPPLEGAGGGLQNYTRFIRDKFFEYCLSTTKKYEFMQILPLPPPKGDIAKFSVTCLDIDVAKAN
ncbi:MAG: hypothetical protein JXQ80_11575, partial [Bacteroidales bacterium]|nr:hypothetical protein [Bacteroidales bacterium]